MSTVFVTTLSGERLTLKVERDATVGGLQRKLGMLWEKHSSRICIMAGDDQPLVHTRLSDLGEEFTAVLLNSPPQVVHDWSLIKTPMNGSFLKIVVVGDERVGKSSLLATISTDNFPGDYTPTVFDAYSHCCSHSWTKGGSLKLELDFWDTASNEGHDRLRPLSYPHTDVFLLCFSVDSKDSLQRVVTKWHPEACTFCPKVPKMMVGLKADLRAESGSDAMVSVDEILEVAARIEAVEYVECSARNREHLAEVLDSAVWSVLAPAENEEASGWNLLSGVKAHAKALFNRVRDSFVRLDIQQ